MREPPHLIGGESKTPLNTFPDDGTDALRALKSIEGRLPAYKNKPVDLPHTAQSIAAFGHGKESEPLQKDCAQSLIVQASLDFDVDVQQDLSTAKAILEMAGANVSFLGSWFKTVQQAYEKMDDFILNPKAKEPAEPWEALEVALLIFFIIVSAGLFIATAQNTHFALKMSWLRNVKDDRIIWFAAFGIPAGAVFALEVLSLADRAWSFLHNWWWKWFMVRAIIGVFCLIDYYLNMGSAAPNQAGVVPTGKLVSLLLGESLMVSLPISIVVYFIAKHWPSRQKLPNKDKEMMKKTMEMVAMLLDRWIFIKEKAETIINAFTAAKGAFLLRVKTATLAEFQIQRRLRHRDYFIFIFAVLLTAAACSGTKDVIAPPASVKAIYIAKGADEDLKAGQLVEKILNADTGTSIVRVVDGERVADISQFDGTENDYYDTIREQRKQEWLDDIQKQLSERASSDGKGMLDIPRIAENLADLRREYPGAEITAVIVGSPFFIKGGGAFADMVKTSIPPDSFLCEKTSPLFCADGKKKLDGIKVAFIYPLSTAFKNVCYFRRTRRVWGLYFGGLGAHLTAFGSSMPATTGTTMEAIPTEEPLNCDDKTIERCEETKIEIIPKKVPQKKLSISPQKAGVSVLKQPQVYECFPINARGGK